MRITFGTDGIRGVANQDLTPEVVMALGRACVRVMGGVRYLAGRDTRVSGSLLQSALSAGLAAEGAVVVDVGIIPTPGLAWLASLRNLAAVMVSASHNPFDDNGIKVFGPGGVKLDDHIQSQIADEATKILNDCEIGFGPRRIGWLESDPLGLLEYRNHLVDLIQKRSTPVSPNTPLDISHKPLTGLCIVLDCANGSASQVAPEIYSLLGGNVIPVAASPDGFNINDGCGSTHIEYLCEQVLKHNADLGLAFDGDADRVLAVDNSGKVVDGDQMIAIFVDDLLAKGELDGNGIVVTSMSNMGLKQAMAKRGVAVYQTDVGDRYVYDEMQSKGLVLGGEQSGHIILRSLATTGDGILTGLLLASILAQSSKGVLLSSSGGKSTLGRPVSMVDLVASAMTKFPQSTYNIPVADKGLLSLPSFATSKVAKEIQRLKLELGEDTQVLVRASGTESVVRITVQARKYELVNSALDRLRKVVAEEMGY
ncbi:MAG: phosphoglucosamine mutase [Actinobacteria bacterium]|nr:phosphoglucosamine mutase [Actinomycetota bacterium]MCL6105370.1 phosphoglucosamine mutase [Actinomycetota bacterium]